MTPEVIASAYAQGGAVFCNILGFFIMIVWMFKHFEKNEARLYNIINILTSELKILPDIQRQLNEIQDELKRGK